MFPRRNVETREVAQPRFQGTAGQPSCFKCPLTCPVSGDGNISVSCCPTPIPRDGWTTSVLQESDGPPRFGGRQYQREHRRRVGMPRFEGRHEPRALTCPVSRDGSINVSTDEGVSMPRFEGRHNSRALTCPVPRVRHEQRLRRRRCAAPFPRVGWHTSTSQLNSPVPQGRLDNLLDSGLRAAFFSQSTCLFGERA